MTTPEEVTARYEREYLTGMQDKADRTRHAHARAIKTLLRFWYKEKYFPEAVTFDMPKIGKKKLLVLSNDIINEMTMMIEEINSTP